MFVCARIFILLALVVIASMGAQAKSYKPEELTVKAWGRDDSPPDPTEILIGINMDGKRNRGIAVYDRDGVVLLSVGIAPTVKPKAFIKEDLKLSQLEEVSTVLNQFLARQVSEGNKVKINRDVKNQTLDLSDLNNILIPVGL